MVSWDELAVVLKKAKKGQYGCWELYADGNAPSKASTASMPREPSLMAQHNGINNKCVPTFLVACTYILL